MTVGFVGQLFIQLLVKSNTPKQLKNFSVNVKVILLFCKVNFNKLTLVLTSLI